MGYHPRKPEDSPLYHLQYVFSIPIILCKFFLYNRKLVCGKYILDASSSSPRYCG